MGKLWDAYKARFADNVRHGAGDGLRAAASGRSVGDVAEERRRKQRPQLDGAALKAYLLEKQTEFEERAARERARGNKNVIMTTIGATYVGGVPVVIKFNETGERGRIDVYYGGAGDNPLDTPPEDYHGHIVIRQGKIESWLEPGPYNQRPRRA